MRRLLGVLVVSTLGLVAGTSGAFASAESTSVFHFSGRAGSAFLTDCSLDGPPGAHCRAVSVFAFEQRVNDNGTRFGGPGLDVTVFDVTIIPDPPFFEVLVVGSGFTDQATVEIPRNLSRAARRRMMCPSSCASSRPVRTAAVFAGRFGVG